MTEQKRGYSDEFWGGVRWLWQNGAVSDQRLAFQLGIDRKHLRRMRVAGDWRRGGNFIGLNGEVETDADRQRLHPRMLELALAKKYEFPTSDELHEHLVKRGIGLRQFLDERLALRRSAGR